MDDIVWSDLNPAQQHAIAVLGAGMGVALCDATAVKTLKSVGLIRGGHLTRQVERMRQAAVLRAMAA